MDTVYKPIAAALTKLIMQVERERLNYLGDDPYCQLKHDNYLAVEKLLTATEQVGIMIFSRQP